MKNRTVTRLAGIILAAVAGAASLQVAAPSPAQAEAPTCEQQYRNAITDVELNNLETGMRPYEVVRLVGHWGTRARQESTRTRINQVFTFCEYGDYAGPFYLTFDRLEDGLWRIAVDQGT